MKPTNHQYAYFQIHAAVVLFGFTAILGDLIQLPAVMIVWWRVLITSVSLLFFIQFGKKIRDLPGHQIRTYAFIGVIIGFHWICFYGSVKLANASVALICMSTTSIFTSLIEPLLIRTKFNKLELILGAMIIPGMVLIVNSIDLTYIPGVWVGLASAFLAAIFSTLNKANIKEADPYTISFIELSSAWGMISILVLFLFISGNAPSSMIPEDITGWYYLLLLSLLCTTLAHVLSLKALKHLSAFASNLVINLEPVYGILLAIFLLNEHKELNLMFYVGCLIIIVVVLSYPFLNRKYNHQKIEHA
ncbi:MAG: EamA family transporter [Saprospiraceae bacterium]|nr:EamA family transporter [Saprospiraceae bacterium]